MTMQSALIAAYALKSTTSFQIKNTVKTLHCVSSNAMCLCSWKMTMCKHKGVCQDLMYKHIVAEIKPSNYFLGKMSHGGTMMVHTQPQILKP